MTWLEGDLLELAARHRCAVLGFTANAYLSGRGALVMGAGAARRVRDAYPGVDLALGQAIRRRAGSDAGSSRAGVAPDYHIVHVPWGGLRIAALQVKRHWQDQRYPAAKEACFALTRETLARLAAGIDRDPALRVILNCPLLGGGGFTTPAERARVRALVEATLGARKIIVCTLPEPRPGPKEVP